MEGRTKRVMQSERKEPACDCPLTKVNILSSDFNNGESMVAGTKLNEDGSCRTSIDGTASHLDIEPLA